MATVGVVGMGFVGGAVSRTMSRYFAVETYDKHREDLTTRDLRELSLACGVIFVCVPTPATDSGRCDTSIVDSVVQLIAGHSRDPIIVIKSTVPPGTSDELARRHGIRVVFNPEFLNARSADEDFANQEYVILGGDLSACTVVEGLYTTVNPHIVVEKVSASSAEMVKISKNAFFATKVSFFNEVFQMCSALGLDYKDVARCLVHDWRIGWEHTRVPGPSAGAGPWAGKPMVGFGGVCLCKDIQSFIKIAEDLGVDPKVATASWAKNLEVRPERDWEHLSGAIQDPERKK